MDSIIELKGSLAQAKIFAKHIDDMSINQIQHMLNNQITKDTQVRFMPDVHAGKGAVIGTTVQLPNSPSQWHINPSVVGVDIGCGIYMVKLSNQNINLEQLDIIINEFIPVGFNIHDKAYSLGFTNEILKSLLAPTQSEDRDIIQRSLGTLGGGNHYIELGKDEEGYYWLSVHSGSRGLGVRVAKHYDKLAQRYDEDLRLSSRKQLIDDLKQQGRHKEIESELRKMIKNEVINDMPYLSYSDLTNYLNDMELTQLYAKGSRQTMIDIIATKAGLDIIDSFDSVHNFIDIDNGIIRKGATSAQKGERLVIPLNMRDGSLICEGLGNQDWNYSAPHGAGRRLSRSQARSEIDLSDYQKEMVGVYSSSIGESTLDEAPMAYKPKEDIIELIKPTAKIIHQVKPVYNFKAH